MKSAAQRRPSRYTQALVVTSIAPNTVTCRFFPGWDGTLDKCPDMAASRRDYLKD